MSGGLIAPMAQMMIARVAGRNMARVLGYAVVQSGAEHLTSPRRARTRDGSRDDGDLTLKPGRLARGAEEIQP